MKSIYIPIIDNGLDFSRTSWALSMFRLGLSTVFRDCEVVTQGISSPYPAMAMNIATNDFLATSAERMLIIDTDEIFNPIHVQMLLEHDLPFVSGLYTKKELGMEFPIEPLEGTDPLRSKEALVEVARCPRGFLAVKREVFETLKFHVETYADPENGNTYPLFWKGLGGGHSEDYAFCDLYRAHGGRIMVDKRITVLHRGSVSYPIEGTYKPGEQKAAA